MLRSLLVVLTSKVAAAKGLEYRDDLRQFRVAVFFEFRQDAGAEKYLRLTDTVAVLVQFKEVQLWGIRKQDVVP